MRGACNSAFDRRRQHNRAPIIYTNGHAALMLAEKRQRLPTPPMLTLLPGLLSVGRSSPFLPTVNVTFAGQPQSWTRQQVNGVLELVHTLRTCPLLPRKQRTPPVKAENVPLLPARCAVAKPITEQDALPAAA